jgi:hypothetical protein
MRRPRPTSYLLYPALLFAVVPGCQVLSGERPVAVLARDADTGRPIPGAEVSLSYPLAPPVFGPSGARGIAGDDGVTRLQAAPGDDGLLVQVRAAGYMAEEKVVPRQAVEAIAPAGLFEPVEQRPPAVVLDLYAEPRPSVEFVVPDGFRGTIKAEVHFQDDAPCPPGQRRFSYVVSPTGDVHVSGPAMLRRVRFPAATARYANGTPLSASSRDTDVGFWWLKAEPGCQYYVVDTRSEYDMLRRSTEAGPPGEGRAGGAGKGGHGRRNRDGAKPAADALSAGLSP